MKVTRKVGFVFVFALTTACVASAQPTQYVPQTTFQTQPPPTPPPTPPATPAQTPVTAPAPPPSAATDAAVVPMPLSMAELRRRRNAIDAMEGMLPQMVRSAAKDTMREIEAVQQQPVNFLTSSTPKARGFHLEGYGVFFYVEIPGVRSTVTSAFEELQRRQQPRPEARSTGEARPERLTERAAMPFDPNASYTEAVKRQLIDAMLDYSQPLDLRPNEWLTIAARDGDEPIPNVIYESITMIVRARGSDLADFRAGRLTREEMLKRVELRGF